MNKTYEKLRSFILPALVWAGFAQKATVLSAYEEVVDHPTKSVRYGKSYDGFMRNKKARNRRRNRIAHQSRVFNMKRG